MSISKLINLAKEMNDRNTLPGTSSQISNVDNMLLKNGVPQLNTLLTNFENTAMQYSNDLLVGNNTSNIKNKFTNELNYINHHVQQKKSLYGPEFEHKISLIGGSGPEIGSYPLKPRPMTIPTSPKTFTTFEDKEEKGEEGRDFSGVLNEGARERGLPGAESEIYGYLYAKNFNLFEQSSFGTELYHQRIGYNKEDSDEINEDKIKNKPRRETLFEIWDNETNMVIPRTSPAPSTSPKPKPSTSPKPKPSTSPKPKPSTSPKPKPFILEGLDPDADAPDLGDDDNEDVGDDDDEEGGLMVGTLGQELLIGGGKYNTLYECLLNKNSNNLKECLNSLRKHDNFNEIAKIEVNSVKPIVLMRTLEKYGLKRRGNRIETVNEWLNRKGSKHYDTVNNHDGKQMLEYIDIMVKRVNSYKSLFNNNNLNFDNDFRNNNSKKSLTNIKDNYLNIDSALRHRVNSYENQIPSYMIQYLNNNPNINISETGYKSTIQGGGGENIFNSLTKSYNISNSNLSNKINEYERKTERLIRNTNLIKNLVYENINNGKHSPTEIKSLINKYIDSKNRITNLHINILDNMKSLLLKD
jgi:hypothetical protein